MRGKRSLGNGIGRAWPFLVPTPRKTRGVALAYHWRGMLRRAQTATAASGEPNLVIGGGQAHQGAAARTTQLSGGQRYFKLRRCFIRCWRIHLVRIGRALSPIMPGPPIIPTVFTGKDLRTSTPSHHKPKHRESTVRRTLRTLPARRRVPCEICSVQSTVLTGVVDSLHTVFGTCPSSSEPRNRQSIKVQCFASGCCATDGHAMDRKFSRSDKWSWGLSRLFPVSRAFIST